MQFERREPAEILQDLEAATRLVSLVREAAPAHGDFEIEYLEPMKRLAAWVLELPLCPEHHAEPGGLVRHAIQAGYFALRLADGVVFGAELGAEARRVVEIQSRRAAFLASLGSTIALPHRHLTVRSADSELWSEFSRPLALSEWAAERGGAYAIAWRAEQAAQARNVAIWLAAEFVAPYMGSFRRDAALAAMAALSPDEAPSGAPGPLERIVRHALQSSAELARKREQARYAAPEQATLPNAQEIAAHVPGPPARGAQQPVAAPPLPQSAEPSPALQPAGASSANAQDGPEGLAQSELHLEGGSVATRLAALPTGVRELLEALAEDIRTKEAVRRRVSWDDAGWLLLDQALLGGYGMGAPAAVAGLLKRARIAQDGNGRALRIVADIGEWLLPRKAA